MRVVGGAALLLMAGASPVAADAPGPTDYRTEVLAIEPPSSEFEVEIIGGDSFVLLRQTDDVVIEILGYRGEPYLRFEADGTIEQNLRSPAVYLNEERYGSDESDLPALADADAPPEWDVVGDGGSYAWHDHRAHWMLDELPFGKRPGDQILEGVIPVFVDGREVDIRVGSYWQEPPSRLPLFAGLAVGSAGALLVWRRRSFASAVVVAGGVLGLLVGGVQFGSVPPETGPSLSLILLPVVALASGGAGLALGRKPALTSPLVIGGAASLLLFAAVRLPTIGRAILPTELPFALDRAISGGVAIVAAATLVIGALDFSRLLQAPRDEVDA